MGRALALLAGFVVMFLFLPRSKDDPVSERSVAAGIVALSPGQSLPEQATQWFAQVRLEDGRHVRILFPAPRPRDGDAVPLLVERHQSGASRYFLDAEKWKSR